MHQWPRARAGESKTARGAKGAPKAHSKHNQRKKEREKPAKHNEKEGPGVATTGGGAEKAEEDRAEEAAHITLE